MADVADGRIRADAGPGASLHRAGERDRPRLRPETVYDGDPQALWCAGSPVSYPRVRRRPAIGRRLRDPRLGLAAPAPQGRAVRFPPCQTLVRGADGAPRDQARHGSEAGLSFLLAPSPALLSAEARLRAKADAGRAGWGCCRTTDAGVRGEISPTRRASRVLAEALLRRSYLR